jgi:trimeric autotransporter adhesin
MSLRTTQQIDKLLVGQIFPRDSNQNFISTGQILLTDNQGRANWTSLSSIGGNYAQFTSLSTNEGVIVADQQQTTLNFREGAGVNLQIISNALYLNTTAFTAIDIDGGNSLLSSNISNNVINPRLRFVNGNYTKIRGDPGTNSIFIDVDLLSTTRGARAAYTSFIIQNNSSYVQPPATESIILNAIVSDASLTLIGVDDLQVSIANFSPSCNVVYLGLSTITAAKFSTLYTSAFDGLSNLSVSIDLLNSRQINTQGVTCNQFFPVSTQVWRTSTTFSAFYNFTFNPLRDAVTAVVNDTVKNYSTLSSYINSQNIYTTGLSNAFTTVSNTAGTNATNITTISNLLNAVSTNVTTVSTGLNTVSNTAATNASNITTVSNTAGTNATNITTISNLLNAVSTNVTTVSTGLNTVSNTAATNASNITTVSNTAGTNATNITTISNLLNAVSTNVTTVSTGLNTVSNTAATNASNITTVSNTAGTNATNITTISNLANYLLSVSNYSAVTMSTSYGFFSTISAGTIYAKFVGDGSGLTGIATGGGGISIVPPVLSTTFLSTGFLSASNISVITMSTAYGFFSTISAGTIYAKFVGDGSGLTGISGGGGISIVPPVLSTTFLSTGFLSASNISVITMSTAYGFFSTISAGTIYGRFVGDGSGLTGISGGGGISIVPPVLSTTFLSTGFLSASNISVITMSTAYGFFSTISAGTIYGRFAGDASLLTAIPNTGAVLTVSNNVTTVSNLLNSVSTNVTTVSTNLNTLSNNVTTVSNLLNSVSTNVTTVSTNLNTLSNNVTTVSNLLNSVSTNVTTVSTNLNTLSNNVTTVSNLLNSVSTNVTTVSTNLNTLSNNVTTVSNLLNSVSTNVTTVSTNLNTLSNNVTTVSNLLNSVSTNVTTVSTNLNTLSNNVTTVSNLLNSVSTNVTTVSTNLNTLSNNVTTVSNRTSYLLTVSNYSAITTSTSYGFFSTISAGTIYGRFIGDGSGLTGITSGGTSIVPPVLSTTLLSTGILTARSISTLGISTNTGFASSFNINRLTTSTITSLLGSFSSISAGQAYISSLTVDSLFIGNDIGFTNMGDIIATSLSTLQVTTGNLIAVNLSATRISTSQGFFSTISAGTIYAKFVGDGSGLTGIASGGISIVPPVLSTTFLSTGFLSASNISAITMSTAYGFFSTISAGTIYGRFAGDASLLTSIPNNGAVLTVSNNTTTVSNLLNSVSTNVTNVSTNLNTVSNLLNSVSTNVTNVSTNLNTLSNNVTTVSNRTNFLLTVSNYSAITTSTSYGFFSTISAGTLYGRFVGDASLLTAIPNNGAVLSVSNNVTTVSNLLNSVSTNVTNVSTNLNTVSNLLNAVSTNVTSVSTNVNTVSNLLNSVSTNVTTVSTNLNTVSNLLNAVSTNVTNVSTNLNTLSNNGTTVSNRVNYLLTVSNYSAITTSTSYGFFSTISAGTIYARFIGDGSGLTGIASGGISIVPPVLSTIFLSTGFLSASNISAITMSTAYGFFSTISAGTIYGRFAGDASLLTSIPNTGAVLAVSNNVTTVSNLLNSVSTNVTTVSTNLNTVSNLLNSVSTNVTTVSTNLNTLSNNVTTVSNLLNSVSTNVTTVSTNLNTISNLLNLVSTNVTIVSTNLNTLSNNVTTVSNRTSYLLTISNYSAITTSTSYGFYSTISAGTIYGRFIGDASLQTAIPNNGAVLTVSNNVTTVSNLLNSVSINVTTVSTNLNTVSNLLNSVSTNVTTVSTNLNTVSNLLNAVSTNATTVSTNLNTLSNNVTTVSNLLNSVSTNVTTVSTNLNTVSNRVNYLLAVSNYSAITTSTSYGFYSTISAGTIYGRFIGDGSGLTGIATGGISIVPPVLSTTLLSTGILTARNISTLVISTNTGFASSFGINNLTTSTTFGLLGIFSTVSTTQLVVSSLTVNSLMIGGTLGYVNMGDIVTTSLSTLVINAGSIIAQGISTTLLSTTYGLFSTISAGTIYGRFIGDGSGLTGITGGGGISIVPPVLSTTFMSTGFLSASNISAITMSTTYGFFSTISAGTIYGRFAGDASLLTSIPNNGAVLAVSNNVTTVSNLLNAVSTNVTSVSTNLNTVSNLLNSVSTNITTVSTNLNTVSNLLNSVSTNITTVSTNLNTVSNNATIVSNRVNYLLTVSNYSAITTSTSYGFFSTISAGTIYARFVGDASLLTSIPNTGAVLAVSNNVTTISNLLNAVSTNVTAISTNLNTVSNNVTTVSNLLNAVSTNVTTVSTNLNTVSNNVTTISNLLNAVSTNVTTVSTNLNTVSNNATTVSNRVNYLLTVSNYSAITTSTSYGFYSTISAGTIYGRFVGDASLLTAIPNTGAVLAVSNNVTTVSNLLNSVSTNVTSVSTNLNTVSNNATTVSNRVNYLLTVSNYSAITTSTSYGFFSTLSSGSIYGRFIGDASLLTAIPNTGAVLTVSNNVTTISNLLNAVSTNVTTVSTNLNTVSNTLTTVSNSVNYLLTVSNTSAITTSTSYGFFSTLSSGNIYGRFIGDGSLLTGLTIPNTGAVLTVSNNLTTVSNSVNYLLTVSNTSAITTSTSYGFFSTLSAGSIYSRFIGDGSLLTGLRFLYSSPPVLSTTFMSTGFLSASNISAITMSTNYGFFSTISAGTIYAKFVGDGSGLTGITSGGLSIVPPVLSTTLLSTGILTASNISTAVISTLAGSASSFFINRLTTSTVSALVGSFSTLSVSQVYISSLTVDNLTIGNDNGYINMGDVIAASLSTGTITAANIIALNISTTRISTSHGFFSTISAGTVYGKFVGDGSGLTGITGSGGMSIVPPVLSTTFLSTGFLSASNISAITMSTNYGFFSTISTGTVYGRHLGDGSGLTNLPTSSLSLSSGNISISTITLVDTVNNSTGTIFERSSLLYFNAFVIGGASVWQSQLLRAN